MPTCTTRRATCRRSGSTPLLQPGQRVTRPAVTAPTVRSSDLTQVTLACVERRKVPARRALPCAAPCDNTHGVPFGRVLCSGYGPHTTGAVPQARRRRLRVRERSALPSHRWIRPSGPMVARFLGGRGWPGGCLRARGSYSRLASENFSDEKSPALRPADRVSHQLSHREGHGSVQAP